MEAFPLNEHEDVLVLPYISFISGLQNFRTEIFTTANLEDGWLGVSACTALCSLCGQACGQYLLS